jgi:hypothetical protein
MFDVGCIRFELWTDQPVALAPFVAAHRRFRTSAVTGSLRVLVLAGAGRAHAPCICFPELEPCAIGRLIARGGSGRFELLRVAESGRRALYRDRLLDLNPALVHTPDGCEVIEPRLLSAYLELLLLNAALERMPGLVAAHAAVVARGNRAAWICGESGAGKTTLTLALLRSGCAYLSDEVALLDLSSRRAHPYPRSLGIREGALGLFGDETMAAGAFQATSLAGERKWFVDPDAVAPDGAPSETRLEFLWFLRGWDSEPRVTNLDPWHAARRLAVSLRHVAGTVMERFWTAVAITDTCRTYEIVAGPPLATAAALIQLLDQEREVPMK